MSSGSPRYVSVVVPCHNEADTLDAFLTRVTPIFERLPRFSFEIVLIDDGSTDATEAVIARLCAANPGVKGVSLSRNFGHQRAITAGLDYCMGDYIIVIDADLQDPPELIPDVLAKLEEGFDVVHTVRTDRSVDSFWKRKSAKLFYALMRRWVLPEIVEDAADYKGFTRQALEALRAYPERVRFLRGMFATLGFRQSTVPFVRAARGAGQSKYSLRNMLRFARDAIVSNTVLPLRLGFYFGVLLVAAAGAYGACVAGLFLAGGGMDQPLVHLVLSTIGALFGVVFILLGMMGEYLKCIILEVKARPLYVVRKTYNLPAGTGDQSRRPAVSAPPAK